MSPGSRQGLPSMLIVAGHLILAPEDRDAHVAASAAAVAQARAAPGCLDFAVTADTLDPQRVNVFERWESEAALLLFRGDGLSGEQAARVVDADVRRYVIASVGAA
jgi:heme-degrading monooxygenase HmoA